MDGMLKRLYVFNYGGPIFVIQINKSKIRIFTRMNHKALLEGMAIVANLVRRYANDKVFVKPPYVGFFGKNYILVGRVTRDRFAAPALGLIRRIVLKLDEFGDLPTDYLIRIVLDQMPEKNKYRVEII